MLELKHKDMEIYTVGMKLLKSIYSITDNFPKTEMINLTSQMRRCTVSILSNFAEGLSRKSDREKIRFLEIARSSLVELDIQLEISKELNYLTSGNETQVSELLNHLFAMFTNLINKINKN